jgi:hypothetical protein
VALEGADPVVHVDQTEEQRAVEEVAVQVEGDQWELRLTGVLPVRFRYGARGRRQEQRPVARLAVVVTGPAEPGQDRERDDRDRDEHRQLRQRRTEVGRALDAVVGQTG